MQSASPLFADAVYPRREVRLGAPEIGFAHRPGRWQNILARVDPTNRLGGLHAMDDKLHIWGASTSTRSWLAMADWSPHPNSRHI